MVDLGTVNMHLARKDREGLKRKMKFETRPKSVKEPVLQNAENVSGQEK